MKTFAFIPSGGAVAPLVELATSSAFHHLGIVPHGGGLVALLVLDGLVIAAALSIWRRR